MVGKLRSVPRHLLARLSSIDGKLDILPVLARDMHLRFDRLDEEGRSSRRVAEEESGDLMDAISAQGKLLAELHWATEDVRGRLDSLSALSGSGAPAQGWTELPGLTDGLARVANWATSHAGWASQAGLWFNPPVSVEHLAGDVQLRDVTERIAEIPFVYQCTATLPPGARVLDVGCVESTVSLSLASLGFQVTGIDLRPYRLTHPNLTSVVGEVQSLTGEGLFDAVISLSTLEHIGIGAYEGNVQADADLAAMRRLRELCKRGGKLIFTAPYGRARTNELERTYDADRVAELLQGWTELRRLYLVQQDSLTWMIEEDPGPVDTRAAIFIEAVKDE